MYRIYGNNVVFHGDLKRDEHCLFPTIDIVVKENFDPVKHGICKENIVKSYRDFQNCKFLCNDKKSDIINIACWFPEVLFDGDFFFKLISILNQLSDIRFSLFINKELTSQIDSFCNEHITVLPFSNKDQLTIKTDLILTYGISSIHYIRSRMPVIIFGPKGLGGFVTPENLKSLYNQDFIGRPGGTLNERIPVEIVAHEIGIYKDKKDMTEVLNQNKIIADSFPINPLSVELYNQQVLAANLFSTYNNIDTRKEMKPRLCSNIEIICVRDILYVKRVYINDIICNTTKEDKSFFNDLNGHYACGYLMEKYNIVEDDFWNIIENFLNKRIITLVL